MEQMVLGLAALVALAVVRGREVWRIRWQPDRHTWVAVGCGLLAFGFSSILLLFPMGSPVRNGIHYGLIYVLCGVLLPWGYTLLGQKAAPAQMGVHTHRWRTSLILGLGLAALFSLLMVFEADLSSLNWNAFARASVVLSGAGGLFELFLYYGFIHLRLEKAFGVIPAVLGTSFLYILWHTGTQLPLEPDPGLAIIKLFGVGVLYQSIFSMTGNLLVIWPFFHWAGVMIDFRVNLDQLEAVSYNFPWALGALLAMAISVLVLGWLWQGDRLVSRSYSSN